LFKKKFGRSPSEYQSVFMVQPAYAEDSESLKIMS
jgi:hypothetical protein